MKISLSEFRSLSLAGAVRFRTSSYCRRKRISASREVRDPRIQDSSARKRARTLNIRARDYSIGELTPPRMRFLTATADGKKGGQGFPPPFLPNALRRLVSGGFIGAAWQRFTGACRFPRKRRTIGTDKPVC